MYYIHSHEYSYIRPLGFPYPSVDLSQQWETFGPCQDSRTSQWSFPQMQPMQRGFFSMGFAVEAATSWRANPTKIIEAAMTISCRKSLILFGDQLDLHPNFQSSYSSMVRGILAGTWSSSQENTGGCPSLRVIQKHCFFPGCDLPWKNLTFKSNKWWICGKQALKTLTDFRKKLSPWHIVLVQDEVQSAGRLLEKVLDILTWIYPNREICDIWAGLYLGGNSRVMGIAQ